MAWGQDNFNSSANFVLRDYAHASRIFRTNGYENSPRYKFLFHVYFNINVDGVGTLKNIYSLTELATIGMLVKTIQLPQFKIATDVLNQYNRKRIVQKKVEYEPVKIEFHDDGGDNIRNMWYNYFSYYYKDPTQNYGNDSATNGANGVNSNRTAGFNYNARDTYAANRQVNDWGYIGESYSDNNQSATGKPPFFNDITVYGFDQHKFAKYVFINPIISSWEHDTYNYSEDNGVMQNSMSIQYETVKYYSGAIGNTRPDTNVTGFADPASYDQTPSSLWRPGGQSSSIGQGGLVNNGVGQQTDLQTGSSISNVGGTQQPNVAYNTPTPANPTGTPTGTAGQQGRNTNPNTVVAQPNSANGSAPIFPTPPTRTGP